MRFRQRVAARMGRTFSAPILQRRGRGAAPLDGIGRAFGARLVRRRVMSLGVSEGLFI